MFAQEPEFPVVPRPPEGVRVRVQAGLDAVHRSRQAARRSRSRTTSSSTAPSIFKYKDRTERVTQNTEQDLTNGIIKVVSGQQKKVYFTQGHGEKDPTSGEREGYGTIGEALKRENYAVEKLVLAQAGAVPDDASVVVVAGPQTRLLPA